MSKKKKAAWPKSVRCRHCLNKRYSRECCAGCYSYGRNKIRSKEKTDDQLVEEGFFAAKEPLGRPVKSGLGKKIKAAANR